MRLSKKGMKKNKSKITIAGIKNKNGVYFA
jgi:hypothetical protein